MVYADLTNGVHVGIISLVFLSKIDAYDPDVIKTDLAKTFYSSRLLHLVEVSTVIAAFAAMTCDSFAALSC